MSKIVTAETEAAVNEQIKAGKMRVALPIVGVRQKLSEGVMGQIEREVLEEEGIKLEDMRVNPLSRVGGKGGLRTAAAPVKDFKFQVSADAEWERLPSRVELHAAERLLRNSASKRNNEAA